MLYGLLPLLIFILLVAAAALGLLLIGRRRPGLGGSYSMLYLYLVFASYFFSSFSTLGAVAGLFLATALLTPWLTRLGLRFQKPLIPQLASTTLLLTLIIRPLNVEGLEFPILVVFAVALVSHTLLYERMGPVIAQAVSASAVLGLLTALTTISFPAESTTLTLAILLLATASAGVKTASTFPQAFTAVAAAVLLFIVLGIFLSPLSETQPSISTELGSEALLIIPAAFAALYPTLSGNGGRFGDAVMASAAAGLAMYSTVFHTGLANLLTPLTGLPTVDASAALIRRVLQVIALAAAVGVVGEAVKTTYGVKLLRGKAPHQLLPMSSIVLALAAATSNAPLTSLVTGLGAVNIIAISTLFTDGGWRRKLYSGLLLVLGLNFAAAAVLQMVRISTDLFALLALLPAAVVAASAVHGLWMFAKNLRD